jgi:hypothetical protein
MAKSFLGASLLWAVVWPAFCPAGQEAVVVEVRAGSHDREGDVVSIELPAALRSFRQLGLVRIDTGQSVPLQVEETAAPRAWWNLGEKLPAGKVRTYRLQPAGQPPGERGGVTVEDDGRRLWVKVAGKPVMAYNHAIVPSPVAAEPYYAKSGYFHPVFTPSGQILTDDFNPNHPHQHGIMFAWRKTTFEGRATNGWDQKSRLGRVEHVRVARYGGGPVFGFLDLELRQVDLTAPAGPKPVLDITLHVRVYNSPQRFVADLDATHVCAGPAPVVVEKVEYGGLMIRGRADWTENHRHDYLTSDGKSKIDGNHTRPRWLELYGPVGQGTAGLSVLDHPENFRFPQPVRLAPEVPYFCMAPAVLGSFPIQPGQVHRSRYRFILHDEKLAAGVLERCWQDYSSPPEVRVVAP